MASLLRRPLRYRFYNATIFLIVVNILVFLIGYVEQFGTGIKRILDDCMARAQKIKTPQWRSSLMENRIAQRLSWGLSAEVSQGPFMYKLEAEYEKLRKPLTDMEKELKRRIDGLATSQQRAAARETVRKSLEKKGVKQLPVN